MSDTYTAEEAAGYQFGGAEVPEGFDPNASGYRKPPLGEHLMRIDFAASKVVLNKEFKWKDQITQQQQTYVLSQWQPRMLIVDGPHAGASITDFLPMPTPGQTWPVGLANQWGKHLTGFGFPPPVDKSVPDGFNLKKLDGAMARVTVVAKRKKNQSTGQYEVDIDVDGTPKVEVKMFGYRSLTEPPAQGGDASHSTPPATPSLFGAPAGAATTAPAAKDFDL